VSAKPDIQPDPPPRGRPDNGSGAAAPERRDARSRGSALRHAPASTSGPAPLLPQADARALVAPFADLMMDAPVVAFVKDAAGRYVFANPYLLASLGHLLGDAWYGTTDADLWPADVAAGIRAADRAVTGGGALKAISQTMPFVDGPHDLLILKFPLALDGRVFLGGVGVDMTERTSTRNERDRLAAVIEQVTESVMIADLDARITYVNPAFERISGYRREEVIGRNPRFLGSGVQPPSFYEAMWATLTSGGPWIADFVNRRKDGSLYTEEAVISPIRDESGTLTSYVAVKRDVTQERALEVRSVEIARERALIAETLRAIRAGDTPEETARAICRQVASLTGIVSARLFVFEVDRRATPLGWVIPGRPDPQLRAIPAQRGRVLRARAEQGPWIEPVSERWHPDDRRTGGTGSHLAAHAPIRYDGRVVGLLSIDGAGSLEEAALTDAVPALVEFADLAGVLIGQEVGERRELRRMRERIRAIIADAAFRPVFQPIVDLGTDEILGYEALTRFDDGIRPDVLFAEALAVGSGTDLELATLKTALDASDQLPGGAWLDMNVSPDLILAGGDLEPLLLGHDRSLVLEVTEHTPISDYGAFRSSLARLGPNVQLAVDDAGAGFASLRHILELGPAFVKLDRWLIAGLETDEARQSMIVGLHHFAQATGSRLIAEGIETEPERAALRALGVDLGQGYLLGLPLPAGEPRAVRRADTRTEPGDA
jgi:PAS domain S-box-containing protein